MARLTERGLTPRIARRLAATRDAAAIVRQPDVFDWLRETAPDDPRHSPGRLRRMIEEDWAPPPGFVPTVERARRAALGVAAADEERRRREAARGAARARDREAATAEAALLAPLGPAAEDQAVWRTLVESPPSLPSAFARALFHPPGEAPPPVIIFPRRVDRELAAGAPYRHHRTELERRLRDRFPRYACQPVGRVLYVAYDGPCAPTRPESGDPSDASGSAREAGLSAQER